MRLVNLNWGPSIKFPNWPDLGLERERALALLLPSFIFLFSPLATKNCKHSTGNRAQIHDSADSGCDLRFLCAKIVLDAGQQQKPSEICPICHFHHTALRDPDLSKPVKFNWSHIILGVVLLLAAIKAEIQYQEVRLWFSDLDNNVYAVEIAARASQLHQKKKKKKLNSSILA